MPKRSVGDKFFAVSCKMKCQERGVGRDRGLDRRLAGSDWSTVSLPQIDRGDGAAALSSVNSLDPYPTVLRILACAVLVIFRLILKQGTENISFE
jgi:hypothetical protein